MLRLFELERSTMIYDFIKTLSWNVKKNADQCKIIAIGFKSSKSRRPKHTYCIITKHFLLNFSPSLIPFETENSVINYEGVAGFNYLETVSLLIPLCG